ncbi:MAG: hypothetical protein IJT26_00220 [Bacteroidales bacterium]|nr:hypothetical protein [Bacteroidales bacterium]
MRKRVHTDTSKDNNSGCFNLLIAFLLIIVAHIYVSIEDAGINNGPTTEAIIEQIWPAYSSNQCYIVYSFPLEKNVYYGVSTTPKEDSLYVGKRLLIKYNESKPWKSRYVF